MGEQNLGRITSALGGITGSAQGVISNGGFSCDEPTMRRIITRYTSLADSYEDSLRNARRMSVVEGPGLDYASQSVANAANQGGSSYYDYLIHQQNECRAQAQLFQQALNEYLGVDQAAAEDINKTGDSGGGIL
ncbi:MAG: hypothetical protein WBA97_26520 [Actinophytocola sp.]|uniref:hypothetical protein n=1 Tax=Actinophytocola sp. TaxID=1872138 RepID=UPI003C73DD5D